MSLSAQTTQADHGITLSNVSGSWRDAGAYTYYFANSPSPWADYRHNEHNRHQRFRKVKPRHHRRHAFPAPCPSMMPTASPTASPSVTPSGSPSVTPSGSPSVTASASPTASPSMTPTASPTPCPTATATATPTTSPSPSASQTTTYSSGMTPQPTAEYQTPTGHNQLAWSEAILRALGDPCTSANIMSIGYWMQNEAGQPPYGIVGANNPLNVSQPGYGGWPIQSDGSGYYLMSYPTVRDGLEATVAYLNSGSYPGILSALQQGAGLGDPSLISEIQEYSGSSYSSIPDQWGQSQGMPPS
jgi:hypothetical protein